MKKVPSSLTVPFGRIKRITNKNSGTISTNRSTQKYLVFSIDKKSYNLSLILPDNKMVSNSTLYNCKGNPEIVTKPSAATGSSSEPTISFHSSFGNNATTTKDALFDRKIDIATEGLELQYVNRLRTLQLENAMIVVNYIQAMRTEMNLSDNYRRLNILNNNLRLDAPVIFDNIRIGKVEDENTQEM